MAGKRASVKKTVSYRPMIAALLTVLILSGIGFYGTLTTTPVPLAFAAWSELGGGPARLFNTADEVFSTLPSEPHYPVVLREITTASDVHAPMTVSGTMIYANIGKGIVAYGTDGTKKWTFSHPEGFFFIGTPALENVKVPLATETIVSTAGVMTNVYGGGTYNAVLIGDDHGNVWAIKTDTGEQVCENGKKEESIICWGGQSWSFANPSSAGKITASVSAAPPSYNAFTRQNVVLVPTDAGLYQLNSSGGVMWKFPKDSKLEVKTAPSFRSNAVYFGAADGRVHALNPNGSLRAESNALGGAVGHIAMINGADCGGNIQVKGPDGTDYKYSTVTAIVAAGKLHLLDADLLSTLWSFPLDGAATTGATAVGPYPNTVKCWSILVGTSTTLYHINIDGKKIWSVTTPVNGQPVASGRTAYVPSTRTLQVRSIGTTELAGSKLYTTYTFDNAVKSPSISYGTLYVASGSKITEMIGDSLPPSFNWESMSYDSTISAGETNNLKIALSDDKGLKSATLLVKGSGDNSFTKAETVPLSGIRATAEFVYKTDVVGKYKWKVGVTDIGDNYNEMNDQLARTVTVNPAKTVDEEAPSATKYTGPETVGPKDVITITVPWHDDMELYFSEIWTCMANDFNGCLPASGAAAKPPSTDDPTDYGMGWTPQPAQGSEAKTGWSRAQSDLTLGGSTDREAVFNLAPPSGGWPQGKYLFVEAYACDKAFNHGKASKKCNRWAVQTPRWKINDTEKPVISEMKQSNSTMEPGKTFEMSAKVTDNVELKSVVFNAGGYTKEAVPDASGMAKVTFPVDASLNEFLQGRTISWTVTATDASGNEAKSGTMKFTILDRKQPALTSAVLDLARVREGSNVIVNIKAEDNWQLGRADMYLDGKKCGYGAQFSATTAADNSRIKGSASLSCAAESGMAGRDVEWKAALFDANGNSVVKVGTVRIIPSCGSRSVFAPTLASTAASKSEMLPSESVTLTSDVSDDIDTQTKCGGVRTVRVEMAGADNLWRSVGEAALTQTATEYSTDEAAYKIRSAKATFNWKPPVIEAGQETEGSTVIETPENLGGLGGGFGGLLGMATFTPTIQTGGSSGGTSQPQAKAAPFGLPGTTVKWRLVGIDTLGHEAYSTQFTLKILDNEAPQLTDKGQSAPDAIAGEKPTVKACWKDNGQIKQIIFESDETGMLTNTTVDVTAYNAWAGRERCENITITAPDVKPGTVVHWKAYAVDMSGNTETGPEQTIVIKSRPPQWSLKAQTAAKLVRGAAQKISVTWTDDAGLKEAILETDQSGTFQEYARVKIAGRSAKAEFLWKNADIPAGRTVSWRVIGVDMEDNRNETDPTFDVVDDTQAPVAGAPVQSANQIVPGGTIDLSVRWTDNGEMVKAVIETDETGTLANKTVEIPLKGSDALATYRWQNPSVKAGTTVKWRMYGMDLAGNMAVSDQSSFLIAEAVAGCPHCPAPSDWSKCTLVEVSAGVKEGRQTRTNYECSEETGFTCKAKTESVACTVTPAESALNAITEARAAIDAANAKGIDTSQAQSILSDAEFAYAGNDYATAQGKAEEAKRIAESPAPELLPIAALVALLIIAGGGFYANKKGYFKKFLKPKAPAAPQQPEMKGIKRRP